MNIYVKVYLFKEVQRIIASDDTNYVDIVDNQIMLKYPHFLKELYALKIEAKFLEVSGSHSRIVKFKDKNTCNLLLSFARNSSLRRYFQHASPTIQERFKWSKQATEALIHIHEKYIIYCDINFNNLLLDECFDIKFCDFQNRFLISDGRVSVDGGASENIKSRMPRSDYSQDSDVDSN
jgi:serine/threonine protein kinase